MSVLLFVLVGGLEHLEHFLFSIIYGILPIDALIFSKDGYCMLLHRQPQNWMMGKFTGTPYI
jgi:hypothetical protein